MFFQSKSGSDIIEKEAARNAFEDYMLKAGSAIENLNIQEKIQDLQKAYNDLITDEFDSYDAKVFHELKQEFETFYEEIESKSSDMHFLQMKNNILSKMNKNKNFKLANQ